MNGGAKISGPEALQDIICNCPPIGRPCRVSMPLLIVRKHHPISTIRTHDIDVTDSIGMRIVCYPPPVGRKRRVQFSHEIVRHLFAPLSANVFHVNLMAVIY